MDTIDWLNNKKGYWVSLSFNHGEIEGHLKLLEDNKTWCVSDGCNCFSFYLEEVKEVMDCAPDTDCIDLWI